jgi:hypothetical protein
METPSVETTLEHTPNVAATNDLNDPEPTDWTGLKLEHVPRGSPYRPDLGQARSRRLLPFNTRPGE